MFSKKIKSQLKNGLVLVFNLLGEIVYQILITTIKKIIYAVLKSASKLINYSLLSEYGTLFRLVAHSLLGVFPKLNFNLPPFWISSNRKKVLS